MLIQVKFYVTENEWKEKELNSVKQRSWLG